MHCFSLEVASNELDMMRLKFLKNILLSFQHVRSISNVIIWKHSLESVQLEISVCIVYM